MLCALALIRFPNWVRRHGSQELANSSRWINGMLTGRLLFIYFSGRISKNVEKVTRKEAIFSESIPFFPYNFKWLSVLNRIQHPYSQICGIAHQLVLVFPVYTRSRVLTDNQSPRGNLNNGLSTASSEWSFLWNHPSSDCFELNEWLKFWTTWPAWMLQNECIHVL
jgi:hypothetical protein